MFLPSSENQTLHIEVLNEARGWYVNQCDSFFSEFQSDGASEPPSRGNTRAANRPSQRREEIYARIVQSAGFSGRKCGVAFLGATSNIRYNKRSGVLALFRALGKTSDVKCCRCCCCCRCRCSCFNPAKYHISARRARYNIVSAGNIR